MTDYEKILAEIDRLDSMIPGGWLGEGDWNFGALWSQIKKTSAAFKGARFPTSSEHEQAWSRFQALIEKVKKKQNEKQTAFDSKRAESEELRERFIRESELVLPDSGFGDVVIALMTGGLSIVVEHALDAFLGPFDKQKQELLDASRALTSLWREFSSQKGRMLGRDKAAVFHALRNTQDRLDDLWANYKTERQRAADAYFAEKRERHEAWRDRTLANVRGNQERKSRLEDVLSHKRSHLDDLSDKLADARSDDYRSRVLGWIEEERSAIGDIEQQIARIEGWIDEDLNKLNN